MLKYVALGDLPVCPPAIAGDASSESATSSLNSVRIGNSLVLAIRTAGWFGCVSAFPVSKDEGHSAVIPRGNMNFHRIAPARGRSAKYARSQSAEYAAPASAFLR